jgi:hypothetical protein
LHSIWKDKPIRYSGWAFRETESITVVYREDADALYRTLLHEWAHIITACWNEDAPALFLEGVAVATEYHAEPPTAHANALYFPALLSQLVRFCCYWTGARFYDQEWQRAHYAWAGSFTLYLIERFGLGVASASSTRTYAEAKRIAPSSRYSA